MKPPKTRPYIEGDLLFIRDCMATACVEIGMAHDITDIYSMEDLLDLLQEGIRVSDSLLDNAKQEIEG